MSFQVPAKVTQCREAIGGLTQENEALLHPQDILRAKIKKGETVDVTEIEALLEQHVPLLQPVVETYKLLRSYLDHLKESMRDGLEQAQAAGKGDGFKKSQWWTLRQDVLDDLSDDVGSMLTVKTELEYNIHDLGSKIKRLQEGKKDAANKQPDPVSADDTSPIAEPVELTAWTLEGTIGTTVAQQAPSRSPQTQYTQSSVSPPPETANSAPSSSQNGLCARDEKIEMLEQKIKELKAEKAEYKQKYKAQKKLTTKAEGEVQRLNEEIKRCDEPSKNHEKLREKMEANHQELLNTVRQGFSGVTIEVLRSSRH
ncbi:hypothetical protein BDV95DRAFT_592616 [Massariosphaeria phaeospora]|uniref:Uncharacterized protein n=1 Tax=Massariosphaeria phaeospora TaxID=100035 RepID=A0A7C8MG65_9PLEO|nr:hypothetical protein BDV95DRAFT_592616 [Massariosphaeria phaeospora]